MAPGTREELSICTCRVNSDDSPPVVFRDSGDCSEIGYAGESSSRRSQLNLKDDESVYHYDFQKLHRLPIEGINSTNCQEPRNRLLNILGMYMQQTLR